MSKEKKPARQIKRTISEELFLEWKRLFRGIEDVRALMELTRKSRHTIINALTVGYVTTPETIDQITNYFINRDIYEKEQVEKLKSINQ